MRLNVVEKLLLLELLLQLEIVKRRIGRFKVETVIRVLRVLVLITV